MLPSHLLNSSIQNSLLSDWISPSIIHQCYRSVWEVLKLSFSWSLSRTQLIIVMKQFSVCCRDHLTFYSIYRTSSRILVCCHSVFSLNYNTLFSVIYFPKESVKCDKCLWDTFKIFWLKMPEAWPELQLTNSRNATSSNNTFIQDFLVFTVICKLWLCVGPQEISDVSPDDWYCCIYYKSTPDYMWAGFAPHILSLLVLKLYWNSIYTSDATYSFYQYQLVRQLFSQSVVWSIRLWKTLEHK